MSTTRLNSGQNGVEIIQLLFLVFYLLENFLRELLCDY